MVQKQRIRRLESQGEIFRIQRRFHRGNKSLTIVNETKGCEETPDAALWERLRCGLTETAYNNTISIGQLKSATDSGMVAELRNYIANLNTSGSIALNITRASALLKAQRREMAAKIVPEAARRYTALLGEMRAIEHEISDPRYANELAARQTERAAVKEELDSRQKEKETLLEKAARGQQILQNSHFTDETSVEEYQEQASRTYEAYRRAEADCRGMLLGPGNILCIVLSCLFMTSMGLCIGAPDTMHPVRPKKRRIISCIFHLSDRGLRAGSHSFPDSGPDADIWRTEAQTNACHCLKTTLRAVKGAAGGNFCF